MSWIPPRGSQNDRRIPFFIIKSAAPLNKILKNMGVDLTEGEKSTIYVHGKVTPCPMPRKNFTLPFLEFKYGDHT